MLNRIPWRVALCTILMMSRGAASYDMVRDYSGLDFFSRWDFYGSYDNLTLGDVWWLDESDAFSQGLAYTDDAGHAIIKVDNKSDVAYNDKRNSVRITSQDFYDVGSLWILDLNHIPYGCSVWPAYWTKGPTWPNDGEIDIIEQINLATFNQYALHTTSGCGQAQGSWQSGTSGVTDCSQSSGCTVGENKPNSYREGFSEAGGGVFATQFDVAGIFIWFFSRPDIPASILGATSTSAIDITDWGTPSAAYPSSGCNIQEFFTAQQIVIDITLCGSWAGIPSLYQENCANEGSTGLCYNDNVVGAGSPKYDEAYFDINYLRAYTTGGPAPTPSANGAFIYPDGSTVVSATATATSSAATMSLQPGSTGFGNPSINTSPQGGNTTGDGSGSSNSTSTSGANASMPMGMEWMDMGVFVASLVGLVLLGFVWT